MSEENETAVTPTKEEATIGELIAKKRGNISAVAKSLKVARKTVYHKINKSVYLQNALEDARETMLDDAEDKLGASVRKGEAWAVCFVLKTQGKKRGYVERVEQTGANGDAFDIKKTNARFLVNGLKPPSPYRTVDTKKVARRYFRFNSNKLDDLGNTLGVGRKMKHTGFELWDDCINGDPEAWEMMRMYNRQDVLLLERVYLKLCPYMQNHPNMNILSEIEEGCPVCASANIIRKGFSITSTGKKRRYNCLDCGAWAVGKHTKVTDIR